MNIYLSVEMPDLWGNTTFSKNRWGNINYLVGPNGTGKTRFSADLKKSLESAKFKPRYLSAERLTGLEKENQFFGHWGALANGIDIGRYDYCKSEAMQRGLSIDAFIILKEKINVRIKIEAFLSSIFGRRIRFAEEGGFLKPKLQRIMGGNEYAMKESECHGLKELITLLVFIYDDEFNALIIDEPELHLHPQFQTFLLAEIKKLAGDPSQDSLKKAFFLITHSPYLLDFRTLDDLRQCIVFHDDSLPTYIETLTSQEEYSLKRLLPRLNTHHKQFFFANRPVFVEGYTDQHLFSLVQELRNKMLGATGACFIDVNGKEEQNLFFNLCRRLKIKAQFISDLDVLTRGSLRNSISDDERVKRFITIEGIGTDFMDGIKQLNIKVDSLIRVIEASADTLLTDIKKEISSATETEPKRYRALIAVIHYKNELFRALPKNTDEINFIAARIGKLIAAAQYAGVYLLPKGVVEIHLPSYKNSVFQVPDKSKSEIFGIERDFLLSTNDITVIEDRYPDLIPLLDAACGSCTINLQQHLNYTISEFIGNVQRAFQRKEITTAAHLTAHAAADWKTVSKILDLVSFVANGNTFECRMKLKPIIYDTEVAFQFTDDTNHSKFTLPKSSNNSNNPKKQDAPSSQIEIKTP